MSSSNKDTALPGQIHRLIKAFVAHEARLDINRVPASSGNHGKPGKSRKKVPCMEKSWNLKKTPEKSWNFVI